ncbi:MAG: hypothetical protein Q7L55_05065 [Actinomycetota bacterium]|nr:hypothetical protein [Actinomycetota bacterium]
MKAGIRFRFGAPPNPEPDFVLEDFGIGIEVTRRDYDGVDDLVQDLTRLIGTRSLTLTLTFDNYPLQVRKATKNSIMLRVSQAIETGSQIDTIHEIDTFTGTFALAIEIAQKPDDNDASHVKVEVESAALARTMEHVEEALLAKTRDQQKIEQARSMPTILLIESSDVGYAYMRSAATWEAVLRTWMSAELPFLGVGLVQRNVLAPGMGFTIVLNPHADEMVLERASNVLALIAAVFPA